MSASATLPEPQLLYKATSARRTNVRFHASAVAGTHAIAFLAEYNLAEHVAISITSGRSAKAHCHAHPAHGLSVPG